MSRMSVAIDLPAPSNAVPKIENSGRPRLPKLSVSERRPFITWDGEGITPPKPTYLPFELTEPITDWPDVPLLDIPPGKGYRHKHRARASKYTGSHSVAILEPPQDYVLFGCSTGRYAKAPSLSTKQCFELLLEVESENPNAIHVGFALRYDVNMILKDLPMKKLKEIFRKGRCKWDGYYIEYRPGKWLAVNRRALNSKDSPTVKLFDVFGFFQCSFVKACEDFLGNDDPELVAIREGKAARQSFTYDQLDSFVLPYMAGELRMMVKLMDALRESLLSAGLDLQSWHGAGAVASLILREQRVKDSMAECPEFIREAARYAYAGGRFELFQAGYYQGTVYEYDIRSAYPSAMSSLPNLAAGNWRESFSFEPGTFGIWYVEYNSDQTVGIRRPMPLYRRHIEGMVSYPDKVSGWYWTPEVELIPPGSVKYGYVFDENDPDDKPFWFVEEMYNTRAEWKAEGNSAQMAYKLGLNSLYGKMAQRLGGQKGKAPIYHQLEWAGYVTSATRAKIYRAVQLAPASIIAIETDAVFTTEPLPLPIGTKLGEWEQEIFDGIVYVQNGFYFAWKDGKLIERYRGFDKGSVPVESVLSHFRLLQRFKTWSIPVPPSCSLKGTTTRFIGFGLALHTKAVWRSWETDKFRGIDIGGHTKRKHKEDICPECIAGIGFSDALHKLDINMPGGSSYPHSLPWISGDEPERLPWEVAPDLARF